MFDSTDCERSNSISVETIREYRIVKLLDNFLSKVLNTIDNPVTYLPPLH